ncbi:MAG: hypothetical protein AAFR31_19345 [Cyanobacteria bacterium J06627_8]
MGILSLQDYQPIIASSMANDATNDGGDGEDMDILIIVTKFSDF